MIHKQRDQIIRQQRRRQQRTEEQRRRQQRTVEESVEEQHIEIVENEQQCLSNCLIKNVVF